MFTLAESERYTSLTILHQRAVLRYFADESTPELGSIDGQMCAGLFHVKRVRMLREFS
jgi:hypothetical protein